MNAEQFITEKYESNNWGLYPPSRRLVAEWLKEYADQQLILHGVIVSDFCECDGVQDLHAMTGECRKCGKECDY